MKTAQLHALGYLRRQIQNAIWRTCASPGDVARMADVLTLAIREEVAARVDRFKEAEAKAEAKESIADLIGDEPAPEPKAKAKRGRK